MSEQSINEEDPRQPSPLPCSSPRRGRLWWGGLSWAACGAALGVMLGANVAYVPSSWASEYEWIVGPAEFALLGAVFGFVGGVIWVLLDEST